MTLREKILCTFGLAFLPLLPAVLFRTVILILTGLPGNGDFTIYEFLTDDLSQVEWRMFVGFWGIVAVIQLFRAWAPSTTAYGAWLKVSPWRPGKPLPKGGLAPSPWLWSAVAISSALATVAFDVSPLAGPLAFTSGWVMFAMSITIHRLAITRPTKKVGDWWVVYFSITTILIAALSPRPLELVLLAVVVSMVIMHRYLVSLLVAWMDPTFVGPVEKFPACHHSVWQRPQPTQLPKRNSRSTPRIFFAIYMGLLVGLIGSHDFGVKDWMKGLGYIAFLFVFFLAVISLLRNYLALRPPISWWGRLRSGRLIIPGYDRMMVSAWAGIAIKIVAMILAFEFLPEGTAQVVLLGISTSLALLVLMCTGPDRNAWAMTAPGRMPDPAKTSNANLNQKRDIYFKI